MGYSSKQPLNKTTDSPKSVGIVATSFPRDAQDYAGVFVAEFADMIRSLGYVTEVLAPAPTTRAPDASWSARHNVTWLNAGNIRSSPFFGAGVPDNLQSSRRRWLGLGVFAHSLRKALAHRSWHAQINHWVFPYGLLRAQNAKQIGVFHSADMHALRHTPGRRQIASYLQTNLHAAQFVSEQLQQEFLELLSPRDRRTHTEDSRTWSAPMPTLLGNALLGDDVMTDSNCQKRCESAYGEARAVLGLQRPTFVVLGRLVSIKNVPLAISAFKQLDARADLVVAGDGPLRQALKEQALTLGDKVRFVGHLTRNEVVHWLCAADALVVPSTTLPSSRHEGMPVVISEARALGCPVITTVPTAGSPFDNDPGTHTVPESAHALAAAMADIMELREDGRQRTPYQPIRWRDLRERYRSILC